MLTKSKYCKGIQCPKILWMDKNMPEEAVQTTVDSVFETGTEVGELARGYFGEYALVDFREDIRSMAKQTERYLEDGVSVIAEASFVYEDNFCAVDILKVHSRENGAFRVDLIEVKSSTEVHDIYLHDMAFQYYVLTHCGLLVERVFNMHINNQYVRYGELDLRKLFVLEDCTDQVLGLQAKIADNIDRFNRHAAMADEPERALDLYCEDPYECAYKRYCGRMLPERNVFQIHGMRNKKKYELYHNGVISFKDIVEQKTKLGDKQMRQVTVFLNHEPPAIDRPAIRTFLDSLFYPLYFLDFETFQQAIPQYDGVSPYMQIPFQYSLHVIRAEGMEPEHYEFLGKEGTDPRRVLAERLCGEIPTDVCTLAYNMGFEKGVIKRLAELYADLSEHLMNIYDNIRDLMVPFQKQMYYSEPLQGSYSIKKVLPTLCPNDPELDYHALEGIHNGSEAMSAFAELPKHTPEEIAIIRKNLLAYCRLDTLAMVKIWEKLWEIAE